MLCLCDILCNNHLGQLKALEVFPRLFAGKSFLLQVQLPERRLLRAFLSESLEQAQMRLPAQPREKVPKLSIAV